jgi:putative NIF3 family GTP cyclohydrolase 1 type 2
VKVARLGDVVGYLDAYLRIAETPDHETALNGLQVENSGAVAGFAAAVDASQQTIDRVVSECEPGTMLLVHHGLFWDGNQPVRGRRYHRLKALLDHDIAVYGAQGSASSTLYRSIRTVASRSAPAAT